MHILLFFWRQKAQNMLQLMGDFVPQIPYRAFAPEPRWRTSVSPRLPDLGSPFLNSKYATYRYTSYSYWGRNSDDSSTVADTPAAAATPTVEDVVKFVQQHHALLALHLFRSATRASTRHAPLHTVHNQETPPPSLSWCHTDKTAPLLVLPVFI